MTCTVLYTGKCVRFDHGHMSTRELSDIAWSHYDYQMKTLLFGYINNRNGLKQLILIVLLL